MNSNSGESVGVKFRVMREERSSSVGWRGTILILGSQIVALMTSPGVPGARTHCSTRADASRIRRARIEPFTLGADHSLESRCKRSGKFNARREILRCGCSRATGVARSDIQHDDSHEPASAVAHRPRS